MNRMSNAENAMAVERIEDAYKRIADLEAGIQRLKERGEPTIEAERLLGLLRRTVPKWN
jgi:hypothetical protein